MRGYFCNKRFRRLSIEKYLKIKGHSTNKTGKSFSEALILASIWQKIVHGNSMNNLLSYCGLIDAKIRASDKDLPVLHVWRKIINGNF